MNPGRNGQGALLKAQVETKEHGEKNPKRVSETEERRKI